MFENNMYCLEHLENKILNVCIANHQCQRKLCYECAHNEQVSQEQLIPISNFPDYILKKQKNLVDTTIEKTLQLRLKFNQFKKQLEILGEQFQKCLSDSLKQIQEILNSIDRGDQIYSRLLNFYLKPTEISQLDLELIIRSINQNKLERWNIDKESFINPIIEIQKPIEQHLRDFQTKIFEQLKVLPQLKYYKNYYDSEKIRKNKNRNWQVGKIKTTGMQTNFNLYFLEYQLQKTRFIVEYTNDAEIIHIKDGVKLKKEKITNELKSQNVIRSLDQIRCLEWTRRSDNYLEFEKWMALSRSESFESGGFQTKDGIKIGKWIDLFENFNRQSLTFYEGNYNYGQKEGFWDILSKDHIIGCGVYNDKGCKNGLWVDLHENYSDHCKILYIGQYQSGQKIGKWDTYYKDLIIGGGIYNNKGSKFGKWITLHENFQDLCQVTYSGEYQGRKFGSWNIIYQNEIIGGGPYDRKGQKNGRWIEVNENFLDYCYNLYEGDYVAGKKQGVWTVFMKENEIQTKIGEGYYNKFGLKQGMWVEPFRNFFLGGKITFNGEYDNEIKKGLWLAYFQEQENEFLQIGGGSYDQNGVKVGIWKELFEFFSHRGQIIYEGEYKNGIKYGKWNIIHRKFKHQEFQLIGGGEYDDDGMKHGQWIDFKEDFSLFNFICDYFSRDSLFSIEYRHGDIIGNCQSISKSAKKSNNI